MLDDIFQKKSETKIAIADICALAYQVTENLLLD